MNESPTRGRWVAIVTGTFSVLLGIVYLMLITILDSRGPMLPPPPEALGGLGAVVDFPFEVVQQLVAVLSLRIS